MNKLIEVHDNILSKDIVNKLEDKILNDTPFFFVPNIALKGVKEYKPGLGNNFLYNGTTLNSDYRHNYFILQILYQLCSYKNINLLNIFQGRIFLHLPSPNPSPDNIHVDLNFPHLVCLYYVNDSDGDTILFDNNNNEIQRVTPKKGRIVLFDGSIKHCSSSPSKIHRAIVNFDFTGELLDIQK